MTPEELLQHAFEQGLSALSITDHDTAISYEMAVETAKHLGIELLSGVEFSATHRGTSIHVLGYGFEVKHPSILSLCERQAEQRGSRNAKILDRLTNLGMPVTMEEVLAFTSRKHTIGRPHIAMALVKKGFAESVQMAFKLFLAEGKAAYVAGTPVSVEEAIAAIHQADGVAILAHPHLIVKAKVLRELLQMNFDGLECYYSRFQKFQNLRWLEIAKKKNWLITGGSDFHGAIKPNIALGCAWTDQALFQRLKEIISSKDRQRHAL
jgi:predicted metal-dependent phosphoesterase TrpH